MEWIKIFSIDDLPPANKYYFVKLNINNWHDSDDQENVTTKVAKLCRGLSIEERSKLPSTHPNKYKIRSCDEDGNNLVPYNWEQFGPGSYFGQDVSHYAYIPEIKSDEYYERVQKLKKLV